jgi:hypothetical protein
VSRSSSSVDCDVWRFMAESELSSPARLLFVHLATTSDVSWAGVTPLAVARWSYLTGLSTADVESALAELVEARYVLADPTTAEVLVHAFRTWNRGPHTRPPSSAELVNGVISPVIREELAGASRQRR